MGEFGALLFKCVEVFIDAIYVQGELPADNEIHCCQLFMAAFDNTMLCALILNNANNNKREYSQRQKPA